ncbi:MAG: glycosyltransferase family 4 protein [Rhodospirillales bacterium]|nr:glycosyltransferase family 4 protein [Rhodospirillales bacterium]
MRVLFVIHELALNGAVTALLSQTRALLARGDEVTLLVPELAGDAAALAEDFRAAGARLATRVTAAEFDVAVGCTVFAADALAALAGHLPFVWWIHEGLAGVRHVLAHPSGLGLIGRAARLVFPGRASAEQTWAPLLAGLPPGRVEVIPALVAPPDSGPAAEKPAGRLRILCVGSVYPRKRQSDLIAAVAALGPAAPIECVLAGAVVRLDPPGEALAAADPARFRLVGGLAPAPLQAMYRSADIFALPSAEESLPIAPIEAAWHGLAPVLSDLPCHAGLWRHGVTALVHPVGDVELLAFTLRMLIESPGLRARLGTAARAVAGRFGPARTTSLFGAMLAEVVRGRA